MAQIKADHQCGELHIGQLAGKAVAEQVELVCVVERGGAVGGVQHPLRGGRGLPPLRAIVYVQRHCVLVAGACETRGEEMGGRLVRVRRT